MPSDASDRRSPSRYQVGHGPPAPAARGLVDPEPGDGPVRVAHPRRHRLGQEHCVGGPPPESPPRRPPPQPVCTRRRPDGPRSAGSVPSDGGAAQPLGAAQRTSFVCSRRQRSAVAAWTRRPPPAGRRGGRHADAPSVDPDSSLVTPGPAPQRREPELGGGNFVEVADPTPQRRSDGETIEVTPRTLPVDPTISTDQDRWRDLLPAGQVLAATGDGHVLDDAPEDFGIDASARLESMRAEER